MQIKDRFRSLNESSFQVPALGLIVLLSALLCGMAIQPGHNWGDDFALYINQARYLLEKGTVSELYTANKFSMLNSQKELGPYLYPGGFPVLIMPVYAMFGLNLVALKSFCAVLFLLSIPLFYLILRTSGSGVLIAMFGVVLLAFNPQYILFTDNVLSDLPFLFFCLLTFHLLEKPQMPGMQIAVGATVFAAYFIRDIGICLLPSLFVVHLRNGLSFRNAYRYLPSYLVFFALLLIYKIVFPYGQENHYRMIFSGTSAYPISYRVQNYMEWLGACFRLPMSNLLAGIILLALSLRGALSLWKTHAHLSVFFLSYSTIVLAWPSLQGVRFLFPLIPLTILFSLAGFRAVYQQYTLNRRWGYLISAVYIISFCQGSFNEIKKSATIQSNQAYTVQMQDIYTYIRNKIPRGSVIAFEKPRALFLLTERNSIQVAPEHAQNTCAGYLLVQAKSVHLVNKAFFSPLQHFPDYELLQRIGIKAKASR